MSLNSGSQPVKPIEEGGRTLGRTLTFSLGAETYGIDILEIQEVIGYIKPIDVPQTSQFLSGVINLRGAVIPVLDLREVFGLPTTEYNVRSSIIVLQPKISFSNSSVGVVVDKVVDVVALNGNHLQPVPNFGGAVDIACLLGLARLNDETINIIDMGKIIDKCREAVVCNNSLSDGSK